MFSPDNDLWNVKNDHVGFRGWGWQLDSHPHINEIGGETGFFVSADGDVIAGVDVEAELGQSLRQGPGFEGVDNKLVDAFTAVGGLDVHKAAISMMIVFEVMAG